VHSKRGLILENETSRKTNVGKKKERYGEVDFRLQKSSLDWLQGPKDSMVLLWLFGSKVQFDICSDAKRFVEDVR